MNSTAAPTDVEIISNGWTPETIEIRLNRKTPDNPATVALLVDGKDVDKGDFHDALRSGELNDNGTYLTLAQSEFLEEHEGRVNAFIKEVRQAG